MKKGNKILNITLAFSLAIFIVALFGILTKYFVKEIPTTKNTNTQTEEVPLLPQEGTPLKLKIKQVEKTKIKVSIENIAEKEIDVRAFAMEIVLNEPLYNLTGQSIQNELEKDGFIFPIKKAEVKENKTLFKLAGVAIGKKLTINAGQELILATIDLGKEFDKKMITVGEETKIIDNSGKELGFTIENE